MSRNDQYIQHYYLTISIIIKAKIHYTSFPVASPQHKRQVRNKSTTSWCRQKSVVSVVFVSHMRPLPLNSGPVWTTPKAHNQWALGVVWTDPEYKCH